MAAGTVVCDLDGVVFLGDTPVAGAGEALARIVGAGYRLLFCTNNSSRRRGDTAARIERLSGFPADPRDVLSSAEAAVSLLDPAPAFVLGGEGIREALAGAGIPVASAWEEAGNVVVGLDPEATYTRIADAASAVRAGARFVATNDDPTYPTRDRLLPGAGALLAAVEAAAGSTAVVAGKPHPPMRALIRARAGGGPVWVVGDRVATDVAMARAEGWTPVLVLTGVTGPAEAAGSGAVVASSLVDVPVLLPRRG